MYRLSYERRGDISFIAKLCLYLEQKPDYIFKLFTLRVHFKMNSK